MRMLLLFLLLLTVPTTPEATTTFPVLAPFPISTACETTLKASNNFIYVKILKKVVADIWLSKFARCDYFSDQSVELREASDAVKSFCGKDEAKAFKKFIDFNLKKFGCQLKTH